MRATILLNGPLLVGTSTMGWGLYSGGVLTTCGKNVVRAKKIENDERWKTKVKIERKKRRREGKGEKKKQRESVWVVCVFLVCVCVTL